MRDWAQGIGPFIAKKNLWRPMLPIVGIVNERRNQNLAFLMSLPVSSIQYTTAKLISTLGMFLVPWLTLVTAAVLLIETRGVIPRGFIPVFLILAFFPFIGACVITAVALVGETEGCGIAANVFCNIAYPLVWPFLIRSRSDERHGSKATVELDGA
jgi:hypothetical protein